MAVKKSAVLTIQPVLTRIPSRVEAERLIEAAEEEFFKTGKPTTVTARPADIARFLRVTRNNGYALAETSVAAGVPQATVGPLTLISCMANCD